MAKFNRREIEYIHTCIYIRNIHIARRNWTGFVQLFVVCVSADEFINLNSFLTKFNVNCNLRTAPRVYLKCKYSGSEQNNFKTTLRLRPLWFTDEYFEINVLTLHISEKVKVAFKNFVIQTYYLYIRRCVRIIY